MNSSGGLSAEQSEEKRTKAKMAISPRAKEARKGGNFRGVSLICPKIKAESESEKKKRKHYRIFFEKNSVSSKEHVLFHACVVGLARRMSLELLGHLIIIHLLVTAE